MQLNDNWFTEIAPEAGMALSFKLKQKLHEEHSAYQHIEIYATEDFGTLMVIDGCVMLTARDNFIYHEMLTHPALFTHPAPRRVLIVGGGDCGTLHEALKHPEVERVVQVEIDERVTRLAERYFPELCESNNDPRAEFRFEDGIAWIGQSAPGSLDVIIVDSTDPVGPAEGLFGAPFYSACFKALAFGGLIVQQSESPLLHQPILEQMYRGLEQAGFGAIKTLGFPQPCYPSGWWSATLARKHAPIELFREDDANYRPFKTRYYSPSVHRAALALPPFVLDDLG
jgi:spermidine synthase